MPKHSKSIDPMGFVWPILSSLFGLLVVLLVIFLIWLFNRVIPTSLIKNIIDFLYGNIGLIFVMSIAFNYGAHLSKFSAPTSAVSPLITSIGAVILVFFMISILRVAVPINTGIEPILGLIQGNILMIFAILVVAGYAVYFIKIAKAE